MEERFEELLMLALKSGSTDVHFCIAENKIDLFLKNTEGLEKIEISNNDLNLFNYLQYQAHLDISNSKPQSGSFSYYFQGTYYDFRFSTMETRLNKSGVLRILNCHNGLSLQQLTYDVTIQEYFQKLLIRKTGLVIFSGLTGSGKTTTMYSLLKMVKNRSIYSLEDPIEVYQDNITQLEINEKIGFGFNEGIRQILRHNPDILMIGEIRDEVSAKMAFRAALTGCLVFSSLHSKSTVGALHRLMELGIGKQDLSECVTALFNQRLFRLSSNNGFTCIYDLLTSQQIEKYLNGQQVVSRMTEKIKEAEQKNIICEVDSYD
ncbi:MAG: ATPase, T2SS/T4P/T4SS family [Erysipelotrichia bacterium]|nr:ATPase, T2SS/T4P/T4SS family [Erysipelotrichia bacterium]